MADVHTKSPSNHPNGDATAGVEGDVDADVLAELEVEEDDSYRVKRLQELSGGLNSSGTVPATTLARKTYCTLTSDDDALRFTTEHEKAVLHFFHTDFARCSIMDVHLDSIAVKHSEDGQDIAFGRVDVKNAAFVVEKLSVRVLPCVIGFVKGIVKGRITGFEGICWDGKEGSPAVTRAIEQTLVDWTVLTQRLLLGYRDDEENDDAVQAEMPRTGRRGIRDRKQAIEDEDDEWD